MPPSVISGRKIQRFRFRASNDPEKSRRALRLVFANWLAQVDRPAAERARSATHAGLLIYEADPTAPPAARAVTPDALSAGHRSYDCWPGGCFAPITLREM